MILADKILALRKKNGWSQEELADKLNVSRQSISKWEGAIAIPDISKIIEMAKIFGVTTDYLLKDEIEDLVYSNEDDDNIRKINLSTADSYLKVSKTFHKQVGLGASLCIISPVLLIVLSALSEYSTKVRDKFAVSMGLLTLFLLVCLAVALFVISDSMMKKYDYLNKEKFELAYGVESILKERREKFMPKFNGLLILGISLVILGVLPLIITAIYEAKDMIIISMVGLLLLLVSIATSIFINIGGEKSSYDKLLCEGEFEEDKVKENTKVERFSGFYWPLVVASYLAWSFVSGNWHITWIIWPIASLIFAAISSLLKTEE